MRVVNQNLETITRYDMDAGTLVQTRAVKEDAPPIDNVKKYAWNDEDYEDVLVYIPTPEPSEEPSPEQRIAELEEALALLLSGVTE